MSLSVVLRKKARDEFDVAIDWYERREAGLGADFGRSTNYSLTPGW
jgi:hypothetical protein